MDWVTSSLTPEKPLPSNCKLHPQVEKVVSTVLSHGYLRSALEVHQATPEDLKALGLEGRHERDLTLDEMAALLNRRLGRPLDAAIEWDEVKAIGRERYEPADAAGAIEGNSKPSCYLDRPLKPNYPRSIFQTIEG